jgi:hypothetical protein
MDCDWDSAKAIVAMLAQAIGAVGGVVAAFWAVCVYKSNSRVRRAEWLASLYEKFYERSELKKVREILDCKGGKSDAIDAFVSEEPPEFSDYLNFFEFVAVLHKSRQLTREEIEDLFHYYLDCLAKCSAVRAYIAREGYEQLEWLLQERADSI